MGNGEEPKSEKALSPPMDQPDVHVYPDWAAMQAYYGPRVAIAQYFNSTVASDHAPHPFMWGPGPGPAQPIMPPFGLPYGAIYAHGGIYAHPGVTFQTPTMDVETPTKSAGDTEQGLMKKKLKGFDGLAISAGNGNDSGDSGANRNDSHSSESDGSSDGSIGNTGGAQQKGKERSREEIPTTNGDGNSETQKSEVPFRVEIGTVGGSVIKLEFGNPSSSIIQATTNAPQPCGVMNEKDLKRERRKQSNRESARRSRLRKQAEAEELARRVDTLSTENATLKSEIIRLTGKSEKLKLENITLIEQLNSSTQLGQGGGDLEGHKRAPVSTENLLARVHNSDPSPHMSNYEVEIFKKKSNSGMKLRQLLDANTRADAVAAS